MFQKSARISVYELIASVFRLFVQNLQSGADEKKGCPNKQCLRKVTEFRRHCLWGHPVMQENGVLRSWVYRAKLNLAAVTSRELDPINKLKSPGSAANFRSAL
jgi:hypothetical protein